MILQLNIFLNILKKSYRWILIFALIIFLDIIFITVRPDQIQISLEDFFPLIGYPTLSSNFISMLIYVYQYVFLLYIIYSFIQYDFDYSFENIILRIDSKKWIFYKSFISYMFVILMKIIQISVIYVYFRNYIDFQVDFFISSIVIGLLIVSFLLFNVNFSKKIFILLFVIELIIFALTFKYFNIIFLMIIIFTISIFNIINFKFKNALKLFE